MASRPCRLAQRRRFWGRGGSATRMRDARNGRAGDWQTVTGHAPPLADRPPAICRMPTGTTTAGHLLRLHSDYHGGKSGAQVSTLATTVTRTWSASTVSPDDQLSLGASRIRLTATHARSAEVASHNKHRHRPALTASYTAQLVGGRSHWLAGPVGRGGCLQSSAPRCHGAQAFPSNAGR